MITGQCVLCDRRIVAKTIKQSKAYYLGFWYGPNGTDPFAESLMICHHCQDKPNFPLWVELLQSHLSRL